MRIYCDGIGIVELFKGAKGMPLIKIEYGSCNSICIDDLTFFVFRVYKKGENPNSKIRTNNLKSIS
jgi:hypothetical protein